ncbi:MAG: hypothetical protein NWE98_03465 [Candidatus Bathyarchaeota archaeon]|nr:hypothetical protein [Candidatus Bathyarchaeota archaeon]
MAQVRVEVTSELQKIGNSVIYASQQLSTIGLEGEQARAVLAALTADSAFVVNAGTIDLKGVLMAH